MKKNIEIEEVKDCDCSEDCTCGCQEGKECTCGHECKCNCEECDCDHECDCDDCDCEDEEHSCGGCCEGCHGCGTSMDDEQIAQLLVARNHELEEKYMRLQAEYLNSARTCMISPSGR